MKAAPQDPIVRELQDARIELAALKITARLLANTLRVSVPVIGDTMNEAHRLNETGFGTIFSGPLYKRLDTLSHETQAALWQAKEAGL